MRDVAGVVAGRRALLAQLDDVLEDLRERPHLLKPGIRWRMRAARIALGARLAWKGIRSHRARVQATPPVRA
jgi:hypothetical protein